MELVTDMQQKLTFDKASLEKQGAYWTATEICQQPDVWLEAADNIDKIRSDVEKFLQPLLSNKNARIILTGAGTSAYVGESIAPHLTKKLDRNIEAISTTNIVSNPSQYLLKKVPTLLVSYGRSGNSPESLAAVNIANEIVEEIYHLIITCNENGLLATDSQQYSNSYTVLMPSETQDQSFAMTSSFTSMIVSTLHLFSPDRVQLEQTAQGVKSWIAKEPNEVKKSLEVGISRVVFLGSGGLQGFAKEAALKILELTAGKIASFHESALGFRHGPKSLVSNTTEIMLLASADKYTSLYDLDLLSELKNDNIAHKLTKLDCGAFGLSTEIEDVWAGLGYIVYCQVYAFFMSIEKGITPDNPCPTGEVNRVVKGVTLYPVSMAS